MRSEIRSALILGPAPKDPAKPGQNRSALLPLIAGHSAVAYSTELPCVKSLGKTRQAINTANRTFARTAAIFSLGRHSFQEPYPLPLPRYGKVPLPHHPVAPHQGAHGPAGHGDAVIGRPAG